MQLYLCEKYDKENKISFKYDSDEYWESVEWLVWMVCLSGGPTLEIYITDLRTTAKRHRPYAGASQPLLSL